VGGVHEFGDHTSDGIRRTVVVNHLAPYLLLRLVAGSMTGDDARIVIVGAEPEALAARPVDVDDLNALPPAGIPEPLVPFALYGMTKNMNAMTMYALARRLEPSGVTVNGAHPGLARHRSGPEGNQRPVLRGPEGRHHRRPYDRPGPL
jgi:NAD(P)-dependent dehydrogenase (short-subunit alcohol dehydrogenase family)